MTPIIVEESHEVPLVSVAVCFARGCASDPAGREGFVRHSAELIRRGAGQYSRKQLDTAIEALGGSITVSTHRDYVGVYATSLKRNFPRLVQLLTSVLSEPHLDQDEHDRLIRESLFSLDEIRDDDSSLAARYANYLCVPGHPYGRTALGTASSLAAIELEQVRAAQQWITARSGARFGFAGAISETEAQAFATQLAAGLPDGALPAPPEWHSQGPLPARCVVVDKPERQQTQIYVSQLGPKFGTRDFAALQIAETAFGGTFSSRLIQELRVKRGYSYGASMFLLRGALPYWTRINLAPALEITPDALSLTMQMFRQICDEGLPQDELDFARDHLVGSLAFSRSTAFRRMHSRLERAIFDLPERTTEEIRELLHSFDKRDVDQAMATHFRPQSLCTVMVATADKLLPMLADLDLPEPEVVGHLDY